MKKALYIFAALALVACSKSEVAYDTANDGELVVVPAASNITKAAITDGIYPEENHISLFAFHAPGVPSGAVTDYSKFIETYLYDTEYFYTGTDQSTKIWGGLKASYYWPITGSLVFAGYSLEAPTAAGERAESPKIGTKVAYTLATDKLEIEGYTQSLDPASTFDFLYFGRTSSSYNNRRTGDPIALEFKHALSWITIEVLGGEGALVDGHVWSVTNVKLAGVQNTGDFTYTGTATETKVEWDTPATATDAEFVIFNGSKPLTDEMTAIENEENGTLVIPQQATKLWVTVEYLSPANDTITEEIEIDLSKYTTTGWEAGKRYTYQLTFAPTEITVAPIVDTWPDPVVAAPQF
jgi:hypothetical protein